MTNLLIVQFSSTLAIKHKSIPMFQSFAPQHQRLLKTSWWLKFLPIFQMACSFILSLSLECVCNFFSFIFSLLLLGECILCVFVLVVFSALCSFARCASIATTTATFPSHSHFFLLFCKIFVKKFCVNISYLDNAFTDISIERTHTHTQMQCLDRWTQEMQHRNVQWFERLQQNNVFEVQCTYFCDIACDEKREKMQFSRITFTGKWNGWEEEKKIRNRSKIVAKKLPMHRRRIRAYKHTLTHIHPRSRIH